MPRAGEGGLGRTYDDFCLIFGIPSWPMACLYVTAAVKAASHFGTAYVAAAAEVCSRFIGTCRELSPPAKHT